MQELTKNTKDILLENGIKPTFQRIVIYDFLDHHRIHPNVDKIFAMMHNTIPTISKTTIYNTLNLFLKKNIVLGLTLNGKEMNFDINIAPHHHFYCTNCGAIHDIEIDYPNKYKNLKNSHGHLILEAHGYFKGICKNCIH